MAWIVFAACGAPAPSPAAEAAEPEAAVAGRGWHDIAPSPLPPRERSTLVWTGEEVLVLGGSDAPPCPPNADCAPPDEPPLRDGAAYDPATDTWRAIADAPVPLGHASAVAVDGTVWVRTFGFEPAAGPRPALLAYDIADDRWREVEVPDRAVLSMQLLAAGKRLAFVQGSHEHGVAADRLYDPGTDTWAEIPPAPLPPMFDRTGVWTGASLVVLGIPLARVQGPQPPVYLVAAHDPGSGEWRRLPDSQVVGGSPGWSWVGGRIVNPALGGADGGEVDGWGRAFPHGGILDPIGGWSDLPAPPAGPGAFREITTAGEEIVIASGWALDVPSGTWTELTEPPAGAIMGVGATWAGDRLVIFGGVRWAGGQSTLIGRGFAWRP